MLKNLPSFVFYLIFILLSISPLLNRFCSPCTSFRLASPLPNKGVSDYCFSIGPNAATSVPKLRNEIISAVLILTEGLGKTNSPAAAWLFLAYLPSKTNHSTWEPWFHYLDPVKYKHFPVICMRSVQVTATCHSVSVHIITILLSLSWWIAAHCPWCVLQTICSFPADTWESKTWHSSRTSAPPPP